LVLFFIRQRLVRGACSNDFGERPGSRHRHRLHMSNGLRQRRFDQHALVRVTVVDDGEVDRFAQRARTGEPTDRRSAVHAV
jgi:hypothetical protein